MNANTLGAILILAMSQTALGTVFMGPGGPIPDAMTSHVAPGVFVSTINIPGGAPVVSVNNVMLTMAPPAHGFIGDLQAILTAPNGENVHLFSRIGSTGPMSFGDSSNFGGPYFFVNMPVGMTLEAAAAAAGPLDIVPNAPYQRSTNFAAGATVGVDPDTFSIFTGDSVTGNWTLTIKDWGSGNVGMLESWALDITLPVTCNMPLPACNADIAPSGGNGFVNVDDLLAVINTWGADGTATNIRPQGDTAPLPNGNCFVNVDDLLGVINTWGACIAIPTGACALPNNTCTVNTQAQCTSASGLVWILAANCDDTDGDRIPNIFELNNCSAPALPYVGTNPDVADTDGDKLKDGDETYGTQAGLNLPAFGVSPLRKNALIEVDWIDDSADGGAHSHRPSAAAVNAVIAAFAASPVTNVCGGTGVTLIYDYGQGGVFTGGNLIAGGDTVVTFDGEFNVYKAANFAGERNGFFYYSIHAHRYDTAANGSSGVAEVNGDDHMVTLQNDMNTSNVSKTMMHEFGHNLNLLHGGNDNSNYKPNYNSVMNYRFQFSGTDTNCDALGDGALNFSNGSRPGLNEDFILEANGVCAGGPAINWNGILGIEAAEYALNLNCEEGFSSDCGTASANCSGTSCSPLHDFNDWAMIVFTGVLEADDAQPQVITCDAPRHAPPARVR